MTIFAEIVIPGPWWNKLTYLSEVDLVEGIRVEIPVGRTRRFGFVSRVHRDEDSLELNFSRLKSVYSIVDKYPPLSQDLWKLSDWIGRVYLCGQGEALSVICPTHLLKGKSLELVLPESLNSNCNYELHTTFVADDSSRYHTYVEAIANNKGSSLIIFPEQEQTKQFFSLLPDSIKNNSLIWPSTGGAKLWKAWNLVRKGFNGLVLGGQSAAFVPLQQLSLIIVEEESSGAYVQQRFPFINVKSVLAKRAELCGSKLILGGRLPSSRVYLNKVITCKDKPSPSRTFFVDMKAALSSHLQGVVHPLRISETALRETTKAISENKVVIWILDRKGYVGEVACEECGRTIECGNCGGVYNWDNRSGNLKCSLCGAEIVFQTECPYCRGSLMVGKRPGIDALSEIAHEILISDKPMVQWHADFPKKIGESRKIMESLHKGGLVIGSRLALSLCDKLPVGSIVWIDADSEARKPFYNSSFKAFSMIWESCWRGMSYKDRAVIIQSRIPGMGWQRGLSAGWDYFWRRELTERKELQLPPFCYLIQIDFPERCVKDEITSALMKEGIYVMDPGENETEHFRIWVSVEKLSVLMSALEPFFNISRSSRGFPSIRIWSD